MTLRDLFFSNASVWAIQGTDHWFVQLPVLSLCLLFTIFCVNRVKLCNIQALVNAAGYGLNVSNQLVLNILQIVAIIWSYEVDSQTQVTKTPCGKSTWCQACISSGITNSSCKPNLLTKRQVTWSSNAVEVGLCIFGEVKINNHVYSLDVNSPSEEVYKKTCAYSTQWTFVLPLHIFPMQKLFTYLCRLGFCTIHFWSHGTHGFCTPASSLHECRSMNNQVEWFSLQEVQLSEWSYRRW